MVKSVCSTTTRTLALALGVSALVLLSVLLIAFCRSRVTKGPRDGGVTSGQAQLLYVYMDGCGHCKRFDPVWSAFTDRYSSALEDAGVSTRRINSADGAAKGLGLTGYPSIVLISQTGAFAPRLFEAQRTPANLASFVQDSFPELAVGPHR